MEKLILPGRRRETGRTPHWRPLGVGFCYCFLSAAYASIHQLNEAKGIVLDNELIYIFIVIT